jgi:serine/threonine protein kinase
VVLKSGMRLGPYEILESIGAGGMGEVYRAHDTRLRRDVAVKVLTEEFAKDPDPRQRVRTNGAAPSRSQQLSKY